VVLPLKNSLASFSASSCSLSSRLAHFTLCPPFTLLSRCCHTVVKKLSRCHYSLFTLLLHCCYTVDLHAPKPPSRGTPPCTTSKSSCVTPVAKGTGTRPHYITFY
jgi:hypothetical protein